jgi:hypothetical protein
MAFPELLKLIAWVCMVFWGVWYANAQLERLNTDVFEKTKNTVLIRLEETSGPLLFFGLVLYSPYLRPATSAVAWWLIVILLFVF